jgi:hypothetical protein
MIKGYIIVSLLSSTMWSGQCWTILCNIIIQRVMFLFLRSWCGSILTLHKCVLWFAVYQIPELPSMNTFCDSSLPWQIYKRWSTHSHRFNFSYDALSVLSETQNPIGLVTIQWRTHRVVIYSWWWSGFGSYIALWVCSLSTTLPWILCPIRLLCS